MTVAMTACVRVWYDNRWVEIIAAGAFFTTLIYVIRNENRAEDLTKDGMLAGIEEAGAFILFLSTGVLNRPYCQMEIRHALALKKPVVLCHEADARFGSVDFRAARGRHPAGGTAK